MRPSTGMRPRKKLLTVSDAMSGVGWILLLLSVRMSETASTRRPTCLCWIWTTMITLRAVGSVAGRTEPDREIDDGQNRAAEIDDAADIARRLGQHRGGGPAADLPHGHDVDTEFLPPHAEGDKLPDL